MIPYVKLVVLMCKLLPGYTVCFCDTAFFVCVFSYCIVRGILKAGEWWMEKYWKDFGRIFDYLGK